MFDLTDDKVEAVCAAVNLISEALGISRDNAMYGIQEAVRKQTSGDVSALLERSVSQKGL